jgi:hypothetical protein
MIPNDKCSRALTDALQTHPEARTPLPVVVRVRTSATQAQPFRGTPSLVGRRTPMVVFRDIDERDLEQVAAVIRALDPGASWVESAKVWHAALTPAELDRLTQLAEVDYVDLSRQRWQAFHA